MTMTIIIIQMTITMIIDNIHYTQMTISVQKMSTMMIIHDHSGQLSKITMGCRARPQVRLQMLQHFHIMLQLSQTSAVVKPARPGDGVTPEGVFLMIFNAWGLL